MDAAQMVTSLAPTATVKEITAGGNRVFRLLEESGRTTIVKVYSTPARERRERHALEALAGTAGVPAILERGSTGGHPWIRMTDGGAWSLATLPMNPSAIRKAGAVLRAVHTSGADITNLDRGLDGAYVEAHFRSVLDRLERYRRRLGLPRDVLDAARSKANIPVASDPVPAHTHPDPGKFLVSEDGEVMLIDWEWATLAPPEWDLSRAAWRFDREIGPGASEALWEGYGASFPRHRLRAWTAYHAAASMLEAAEKRDGRLGDLAYLVDDLADSLE
ncbi:MAG: hypothetical protein KatS3mg011_1436 [Acidimicrobiia bacterium]|nr:MAG: hypothetical protein KatS3mg011_1436 [Acidimicrobiia bacterium]